MYNPQEILSIKIKVSVSSKVPKRLSLTKNCDTNTPLEARFEVLIAAKSFLIEDTTEGLSKSCNYHLVQNILIKGQIEKRSQRTEDQNGSFTLRLSQQLCENVLP